MKNAQRFVWAVPPKPATDVKTFAACLQLRSLAGHDGVRSLGSRLPHRLQLHGGSGKGSARGLAVMIAILVGALTGALLLKTSLALPLAAAAALALLTGSTYRPASARLT